MIELQAPVAEVANMNVILDILRDLFALLKRPKIKNCVFHVTQPCLIFCSSTHKFLVCTLTYFTHI